MKVLVSAFTPFNNFSKNYSNEVLKYIDDVDKIILDVIYDDSYYELKSKCDLEQYDLIIAMGEARSRNKITVETQALNISSCSLADNKGICKQNEMIKQNKAQVLKTKVNLDKVKENAVLSNDAGKFVCNNLYFHLLDDYPEKSLFIHIPECNDSYDAIRECAQVVKNIINSIIHI